jgi:hypothetical protein
MSLRDLITFAHHEIVHNEVLDREQPLPPRREPIFAEIAQPDRVPAEGNVRPIN